MLYNILHVRFDYLDDEGEPYSCSSVSRKLRRFQIFYASTRRAQKLANLNPSSIPCSDRCNMG